MFHHKTCNFLFLSTVALLNGQVPVPDRENDSNPYSGNPNRTAKREIEPTEEELLNSVVNRRIYNSIFTDALPSIFREGDLRLRLDPRFGDLFDDENIRFPVGLEYNFSNYFEAFVGVGTYIPSPFKSGGEWGTYNLRTGGKYSWWNVADSEYHLSIGFDSQMPWSDPPLNVTDGWARHEPFVAVSREINDDPATLVYFNMAYEVVATSPFNSKPISPRPRNRVFLRPGIIYYPGGNFRYSTELEYRSNVFDSRSPDPADFVDWVGTREYTRAFDETHEFILSPGMTWFPSAEIRKGFFVPGNWDVGVKLDIPLIDETDENIGVSLRFRWYYDYEDYLKTKLKNWWPLGRNGEE